MSKKKSKLQKFAKSRMHEYKIGKMHSGSKHGPRVKSKKQALAIMLSEARKKGICHGLAR